MILVHAKIFFFFTIALALALALAFLCKECIESKESRESIGFSIGVGLNLIESLKYIV